MRETTPLVSPAKRTLLSETVAAELRQLILSSRLKPGTRLPSEQALAVQFGVSRNVVREGLRRLNEGGLVAIRPGDGVYVQTPDPGTVVNAFSCYMQLNRSENWIDELYEVRRFLEPEMAALAAERATPEEIEALDAAIRAMREHTDDARAWAEADWQFHAALARAAHNTLLPLLLEPLNEQILKAFEEGWHYAHAYESGLRFHTEIAACVRTRDAAAAREAMRAHLEVSYREVSEVWRKRSVSAPGPEESLSA